MAKIILNDNDEFDMAYAFLSRHEGTDETEDRAGPTKYGIPLREWVRQGAEIADLDHDGDIDRADLFAMSPEQAKDYFRRVWWEPMPYKDIVDSWVACKVFDLAVNMGPYWAGIIVQRALRITEDGIIGPITLSKINGIQNSAALRWAICCEAAGHYRLLIQKWPEFEKYRVGWLGRAYD